MLGEEMAVGSQPLFTPSLPSPPLVHPTAHISSLWPCSSKFLFPCSLRKAHPWEGELHPQGMHCAHLLPKNISLRPATT